MARVCAVCGLSPEQYPRHGRLHEPAETFDVDRVVEVEAVNVSLRISLGFRPGSGAEGWPGPTLPARLPGIGGTPLRRDDDDEVQS